ncbi:MAG TPA: hypothetical protein VEQ16_00185 [Acidocella sp.]|nr:hypothetical protein [Acidocella sp.]
MLKKLLRSLAFVAALTVTALAGGIQSMPTTAPFNEPSQTVATWNAFVQYLNGTAGLYTAGTAPTGTALPSIGAFCSASGGTPQTCNGQRGVITTNSLATAASTAANFVINNSLITANNACTATIGNTTSTGTPTIAQVVTGAGTITINIANVATAAALNNTVNINFSCYVN